MFILQAQPLRKEPEIITVTLKKQNGMGLSIVAAKVGWTDLVTCWASRRLCFFCGPPPVGRVGGVRLLGCWLTEPTSGSRAGIVPRTLGRPGSAPQATAAPISGAAAQQAPCRGHHEGAVLAVSMGQSLLEKWGRKGGLWVGRLQGLWYRISVTGPPSGES